MFVVDALVMTDDDAYTFCEKRLMKRSALDPRERVASVVGRMSPVRLRSERVVVARVEVPVTAKEPKTDELPWDWNPLTPIVNPPLAVMFPLAVMSLRTAKLPASSEWMRAEVDSRPPRSRMDIVFALVFATYA